MSFDKAMLDPTSVYSTPEEVCEDPALTREQKISVLRQWEYDAREMAVAEEENMTGGPPDQLPQVLAALRRLGADRD
jgi:hypothetical protein